VSGSWVAGSVRARLLVAERLAGAETTSEIAAAGSLRDALVVLSRTGYRRGVRLDLALEEAERAVLDTTLLHLRLLLGWLPAAAHGLLRTLAAWFELANVEERVAYLAGGELPRPFELGALAVAWPRAADAQSLEELSRALSGPAWTELRVHSVAELGLALRLAWARRVAAEVPEARPWALGGTALLLASELYVVGLPVERLAVPTVPLLGSAWQSAGTFEELKQSLPPDAAWALAETSRPDELWRAEARWWDTVEQDADRLLHTGSVGQAVVTGAVALLAADAHRVVAALETAARGGEDVDAAA